MNIYYISNINPEKGYIGKLSADSPFYALGFTPRDMRVYNAHSRVHTKLYLNRYEFTEASDWKTAVNGRDEPMVMYYV